MQSSAKFDSIKQRMKECWKNFKEDDEVLKYETKESEALKHEVLIEWVTK